MNMLIAASAARVAASSPWQKMKASSPMVVRVCGRVIELRALQVANARASMVVRPAGSVMAVSL